MEIIVAIDDYLRLIVRTRPWTKAHEEELLEPFGTWLYEQPDAMPELDAVTPALVLRYSQSVRLSTSQRDDLDRTLYKFFLWAESRGHVRGNPFMTLAAA